jgi:hypothetical protein
MMMIVIFTHTCRRLATNFVIFCFDVWGLECVEDFEGVGVSDKENHPNRRLGGWECRVGGGAVAFRTWRGAVSLDTVS